MAKLRRTLFDYDCPQFTWDEFRFQAPVVNASNFDLSCPIGMIQNTMQFEGMIDEDPNEHLSRFRQICAMFKVNRVSDDAIILRLFSFSPKGAIYCWLTSLPPGSIKT